MRASDFFTKRLYRSGTAVTVSVGDSVIKGHGILGTASRTSGSFGKLSHPLGELSRPLVYFYGCLSETTSALHGTLTAHGKTYHVLEEAEIHCAGVSLGTRLTLERSEPDECSGTIDTAACTVL